MFALISRLPQPLKLLYVLWITTFAATVVTFFIAAERTTMLAFGLLGVVVLATGLTLVINLNGAAVGLAEATKTYRPLGIDYSRSLLATPRFARLFGAFMIVVAVLFIAQALAQL